MEIPFKILFLNYRILNINNTNGNGRL